MSNNLKNNEDIIPKDKDIKIKLNATLIVLMITSGIIVSGLIYLIHKNIILAAEALLLMPLLVYLSAVDIKLRLAPDWATYLTFVLAIPTVVSAILSQQFGILLDMVLGLLICFVPLFLGALFSKGGIGGADVKIMMALGFLLGMNRAFLALLTCLLCAIIFTTIRIKMGKMGKNERFALIPFIFIGAALAMIVL